MGNHNVTSKRGGSGETLTSIKGRSTRVYGSATDHLTQSKRMRSQTPSSSALRTKSKRTIALEQADRANNYSNQTQSESQITRSHKRSIQSSETELNHNKEAHLESRTKQEDDRSREGRRNIFESTKGPSESPKGSVSTASSIRVNIDESGSTKSAELRALKIPENITSMEEEEQKKHMQQIYLEEFRDLEIEVFYYIDLKWLDSWILYMKDNDNIRPKPKQINNKALRKLFQRNIEIKPGKDGYLLNKRVWVMLQSVYGGGPEVKEGVQKPKSTRSVESSSSRSHHQTVKEQKVKLDEPEVYEKHQLANIPRFPQKYKIGRGVVGFFNNYLYCYLNSCLQMLMSVTPLRDFLVNQTYQECQHLTRMSGRADSPQHMCFAMAKTYYNVWRSNSQSSHEYEPVLRTSEIQSQLRGTFSPMNENDCHEALLFILSRLQEEMTPRKKRYTLEGKSVQEAWHIYRTYNPSVIDSLFCGLLRSTVTCGGCGYESITYDPFYDLSLPIKGIKGDIYTCIDRFLSEERFQKKTYDCQKCRKRNKATKKFDIVKLPKFLLVVFKRFSGLTSKIRSTISYPSDLDLSKMVMKKSDHTKYQLISMMEHLGSSARSGHYIGFFKRGEKWYEADDERIRAISTRSLLKEEAYVLLYEAV